MPEQQIVTGSVLGTRPTRADAMDHATKLASPRVHVIEIRNMVGFGQFAEEPVGYLLAPEGERCPCCFAMGRE